MSFKEKVLSKSNSYTHYKEENEKLQQEIESLKKELDYLRHDKKITLRDEFIRTYGSASSFCNWTYIDYFFRDDFEEKYMEVIKNLDPYSKNTFKWIFLRTLAINLVTRNTFYFNNELKEQREYMDFKNKNVKYREIDGYKFIGDYNLHGFMDSHLTDEDKKFIKNKSIIDAGAFTGDTAIPLSKITDKNVYAFEPFDESFKLLKINVKNNNIDNVVPVKKSLGNINGERKLYLAGTNVQGITSDPDTREYDNTLTVQETTIDTFVKENDLNVGYITIDVEGAELDLLEGAVNTIKTQKPILSISIYHRVSDYFEIIPWVANLSLGYEFEVFKEQPWTFLADTVVLCRPK